VPNCWSRTSTITKTRQNRDRNEEGKENLSMGEGDGKGPTAGQRLELFIKKIVTKDMVTPSDGQMSGVLRLPTGKMCGCRGAKISLQIPRGFKDKKIRLCGEHVREGGQCEEAKKKLFPNQYTGKRGRPYIVRTRGGIEAQGWFCWHGRRGEGSSLGNVGRLR